MIKRIQNWYSNLFGSSSLKRKIIIPLMQVVLVCCVLMAAVSYNAIYTMQQNKIKTAMSFDLSQISVSLSQTFSGLLQISQQMSPEGNIGNMVDINFYVSEPYEKSVIAKEITSTIGLVSFSNPDTELVMYYHASDSISLFSTLPLRNDFSLLALPELSKSTEISFQAPHISQCRFSDDKVISVTRSVVFSTGEPWDIYIEAKSNISSEIKSLSDNGKIQYKLLLLNSNGVVKYSSNPGEFANGHSLKLKGSSGKINGYIWNQSQNKYGFNVVLLMSTSSYNRELYTWQILMIIIISVTITIMMLMAVTLLRHIYRPLQMFSTEMDTLGNGNLDEKKYHTGIEEFDHLFEQFSKMKIKVQQLMLDNEQKEEQRHQMEIEELTYKINPHFLMNTLNSAHWLAVMHNQPDIDKVITTLNLLLNYNLGKYQQSATLRTEIEILRAYLDLQKLRYDFNAELDITEGEYLDNPVARFILQPIVENAICHGLDENGTVQVTITPDELNRIIKIIISDDGKGMNKDVLEMIQESEMPENQQMGRGIGLRYVRSMLKSFYGNKARIYIESTAQHGTTVTMYLPYR
jgi:two-component system sensor histidine kinase YesM